METPLDISTRAEFGPLLHRLGFTCLDVAVEVGVHRGEYARQFLDGWEGYLFLVDPWQNAMPGYVDPVAGGNRDADLEACCQALAGLWNRVSAWKNTSVEAAAEFEDEFAAFVYIDANHAYEHVKADIEAWWPKLRHGGILAGHDWTGEWKHNVRRAVREFAGPRGLDILIVPEPHGETERSWFLVKGAQ
jgi:hypothetical protein